MVITNRLSILITRMLIRLVDTLVCTPLSDSVLGRAGIVMKPLVAKRLPGKLIKTDRVINI